MAEKTETESILQSSLFDELPDVDDAEFGIPKIVEPPSLESILNEPDDDYGSIGDPQGELQAEYGQDDDASSINADTASIASQDSILTDTRRRSPRKNMRYQRHGSVLRLVILKGISSQILSAMDRVDAGMPTALAVADNIAVGTSHGLVLVYDPKQVLRWCLGSVAVGQQYGAVSALTFNKDCTRLLCGFAKGQMTMWSLQDGKLLRTITDAHPPSSAILTVKFTDDLTLAVCSDSAGSVYQLEMKRSIGGRTCESKCIFSGSRGEVCTVEPLLMSEQQLKSHPLRDFTIVALATLSKVIVVTLKPEQKVIGMFQLKGDPSTLPLLTWQFVIIQVSQQDRIVDPVLAFARDQDIYFYQAVCSAPDDIRFSQLQKTHLPYRLLSITWLNSRTMILVDTKERAHVFDVRSEEELEVIDLAGVALVYSTSFYKSLATGGNVSEALAYAGERACYQSLHTYTGQLVALGRKGVHVMTLRSWKDRLDLLSRQKRYGAALQLGASFYDGSAKAIVGLGGNAGKRRGFVAAKMVDVITEYIDFSLATAGSPKHGRREEQEQHFKASIPTIVQHCTKMKQMSVLFGPAYDRYSPHPAARAVFLESLEPYILSNQLTSVTPQVMQDLVNHYQSRGLLQNVEACIVHMDIASLDIHQVFVLCWANGLYDAILHVYNRGMQDYITPLQELLSLLSDAVNSGKQLDEKQVVLGNKMLVYVSCCLAGRAYPYGDIPKDQVSTVKDKVFACITCLHTPSHPDKEPTYPHLRTLLKFDTREFFNVLALAFEDADMQKEPEKKQRVVDILLYIMVESEGGFTPSQAGILFTFLARQMAKQDDSVMVSRALFEQVLEALCIPCEVIDSRHEERQQALMELMQAGGLLHVDEERLIKGAERAKFFQVCERLYEKRREFDKILACYWADSLRTPLAFQYIQKILSRSNVTDVERYKVQKEALDHLQELVEISPDHTAQLVLIGFALTLDEAVTLLGHKPDVLYKFMNGVFQISEETGSSLYMDRNLQVSSQSHELYIDLMCQHEPESVYPYLSIAEGYGLQETLQIVQNHGLTNATAFILEKSGDTEGAFNILFQNLQNDLRNLYPDSENQSTCPTYSEDDPEIEPIRDLVLLIVRLCQRHCGGMEEKEREKYWFPLLDLFMQTQKLTHDVDTGVKSLTTLVLNHMMSHISLPAILQKIMQDPVYSGGQFGEIKPLLIGMLDTYNYEKTLLHTCTSLVNHDLHRHLRSLVRAVNRGIVPRSRACHLCQKTLSSHGEDAPVICFRCGHSYHHICLKGVGSYHTLEGAPVWICHACNKTRRAEPATGRVQRIPSSSGSGMGTGTKSVAGSAGNRQQVTLAPEQVQALDNLRRATKTPSRLALLTELSRQDQARTRGHARTSSYQATAARQSIFEHEDFQLRVTAPRVQFDT